MPSRLLLSLALLSFALPAVTSFSVSSTIAKPWRQRAAVSDVTMAVKGKKSKLARILNKPTLTVSVDVASGDDLLSKRLRTIGIATLFANSNQLPVLAQEQLKAKGDFPGPVPVLLRESEVSAESISAAKGGGATGVVLPFSQLGAEATSELAAEADKAGLETLWEVSSTEDFSAASDAGAKAFLISSIEDSFGVNPAFWDGLPKGSTVMAEVKAMQPGNSEIGLGRTLGAAGCKAVLLSGACNGGVDDYKYVDAAFRALRSKANPEFQIGGLMGQASQIGLKSIQSHATKEPTIIKEKLDHPHMM